ncbi:MAG: epoxide hydrolase [Pseudonocardiales bacterium]|nr:MAG: epoxide hydrolase [Pseudonocardiales bacterium]
MAVSSDSVSGFRLAYDRLGGPGPSVVLLHGWPGDRRDFRAVVPLLADHADLVIPDLRGFGESDKHSGDPAELYSAAAQARSVAALIDELGLDRPGVAGYDIGSRIGQTLARQRPELVSALVVSPPLPGIGDRILAPEHQREFWYQAFHGLPLADELLDGRPDAVRAYLRHFWNHWSGPEFAIDDADLEHLVARYGRPGAFTASTAWYRASAGAVAVSLAETRPEPDERISIPTTVLWPEHDPLFPYAWSDRLCEFFVDVTVHPLSRAGHFTPVEAPEQFAAAVRDSLGRRPDHQS